MMHFRYVAIENIVRKGEIACNKQFLLFSQCFLPYMALTFHFECTLTHYQTTNFRLFQIERLYRQQFQIDEYSKKLFKPVESTVGKGEIACYEQFLLFQRCFQKAYFPRASKGVTVWEWVKMSAICFNLEQFKISSSRNGLKIIIANEETLDLTNLTRGPRWPWITHLIF